jgi:hypothetical protein
MPFLEKTSVYYDFEQNEIEKKTLRAIFNLYVDVLENSEPVEEVKTQFAHCYSVVEPR